MLIIIILINNIINNDECFVYQIGNNGIMIGILLPVIDTFFGACNFIANIQTICLI